MKEKNIKHNHPMNHWRLPVLLAAVLIITLLSWLSVSSVGVASEFGTNGQPLYEKLDLSAVPENVAMNAVNTASDLFGGMNEKSWGFIDEVLAMYEESQDKDVLFIFNPGGWGSEPAERCKGWSSILDGVQSELSGSGVDSLVLTYRRTVDDFYGRCKEFMEIFTAYKTKAKELATRIEFLTKQNPDLKVVVTGESMGTLISGEVMKILADNPQVYSIQTGPPPWHKIETKDRTLIIADNGVVPDTFSNWEFWKIVTSSLATLLHISQPDENQGTILGFIQSPGHNYTWDYPAVSSQINDFLENTVDIK